MANVLRYKFSDLILRKPVFLYNYKNYSKYAKESEERLFGQMEYASRKYPRTKEERLAAAKKYNMHPNEYEPLPPEQGYGDYPKLPDKGSDARDPFYPWDDVQYRRMKNDPIHIHEMMISQDRVSQWNIPDPYMDYRKGALVGVLFIVGIAGLHYLTLDYRLCPPVAEKQYPKAGVVHYTFEPAA